MWFPVWVILCCLIIKCTVLIVFQKNLLYFGGVKLWFIFHWHHRCSLCVTYTYSTLKEKNTVSRDRALSESTVQYVLSFQFVTEMLKSAHHWFTVTITACIHWPWMLLYVFRLVSGYVWGIYCVRKKVPPLQFHYIILASPGQGDKHGDRHKLEKTLCQLCETAWFTLPSEQIRSESKWKALLLLTSLSPVYHF